MKLAVTCHFAQQVTGETRPEVVAQVSAWLDDAGPKAVAWYQQAMADRVESLTALGALDMPVCTLGYRRDA